MHFTKQFNSWISLKCEHRNHCMLQHVLTYFSELLSRVVTVICVLVVIVSYCRLMVDHKW